MARKIDSQRRFVQILLICVVSSVWLFSSDWRSSWAQAAVTATADHPPITAQVTARVTADHAAAHNHIQGKVWKDTNGDGLYQLNEPFLPYTVVTLYTVPTDQPQGTAVTATPLVTATTTITGWYSVSGIGSGSYYLEFVTMGQMFPTVSNVGLDEAKDSDLLAMGAVSHGRSSVLVLRDGADLLVLDAGFVLAAQATVYVYEDTNHNSQREAEEPVLLGSVVILYDSTGKEVSRQVVDQKGATTFSALVPGAYSVGVWPPAGYRDEPERTAALLLAQGAAIRLAAPVNAAPNAITLMAFTVEVDDGMVVVRWTTGLEQGTYGYHLLQRRTIAAATAQQLTSTMVPSQGSLGGLYEVRFPYNPVYTGPVEEMEFWLVEYEISGRQNTYGPFLSASALPNKLFLPLLRLP